MKQEVYFVLIQIQNHLVQVKKNLMKSNDDFISVTSNNGDVIKLHQDRLKGIAHHIWPAAIHLCKYLEDNINDLENSFNSNSNCDQDMKFNNTPIIGLCGIFCSKILYSPQVHITDLEEAMLIINENIELNHGLFPSDELGTIRAVPLDWFDRTAVKSILDSICVPIANTVTNTIDTVDTVNTTGIEPIIPRRPIVIAADCVYFEHLFEPLYHTLSEFVAMGCIVIMCHVRRWKRDNKFFTMCRKTMKCEVLNEDIQYIPDENTGDLRKTITRMYKFSSL